MTGGSDLPMTATNTSDGVKVEQVSIELESVEDSPEDSCINVSSCFDGFGTFAPSSIALLWGLPAFVLLLLCEPVTDLILFRNVPECFSQYASTNLSLISSVLCIFSFLVACATATVSSTILISRTCLVPFLYAGKRRLLKASKVLTYVSAALLFVSAMAGSVAVVVLNEHCANDGLNSPIIIITCFCAINFLLKFLFWGLFVRFQPSRPSSMSQKHWSHCLGAWLCCFSSSSEGSRKAHLHEIAELFKDFFFDVDKHEFTYSSELIRLVAFYQRHRRALAHGAAADRARADGKEFRELSGDEWQRIQEANFHVGHFFGAYGWRLRAITKPSSIFGCRSCLPWVLISRSNTMQISSSSVLQPSVSSFLDATQLGMEDIIFAHLDPDPITPVFFFVADHRRESLVLAISGSIHASDVLTDLNGHSFPLDAYGYKGAFAHAGMFKSALQVLRRVLASDRVSGFLQRHPTYKVVTVGHSLGASVACLLTVLLKQSPPFSERPLHCFAFAPSPVVSPSVCKGFEDIITTIVMRDDVVSRVSIRGMHRLKLQMKVLLRHFREWQALDANRLNIPNHLFARKSLVESLGRFVQWLDVGVVEGIVERGMERVEAPQLSLIGTLFYLEPDSQHALVVPDAERFCREITVSSCMLSDHLPGVYRHTLRGLTKHTAHADAADESMHSA